MCLSARPRRGWGHEVEQTGPCGSSVPVRAHACALFHDHDHRGDQGHVCPAHVHQNVYGHSPLPWHDREYDRHHVHDRARDHVHDRVL